MLWLWVLSTVVVAVVSYQLGASMESGRITRAVKEHVRPFPKDVS